MDRPGDVRPRLDALRRAGAWTDARDAAAAAADALPDGQGRAAALVQLGRCRIDLGDRPGAEAAWRDAVRVAGSGGERERAVAGAELALLALGDGMPEEAAALAEAAVAQAAAVAPPDADVAAALAAVAVVRAETRSGDPLPVLDAAERTLPATGDDAAARAAVLVAGARGSVARAAGRYDDADALLAHAVALAATTDALGPVDRAALDAERGVVARALGRYGDAAEACQAALDRLVQVGGDRHPDAVVILGNLGAVGVARADEDAPAAAAILREVVARLEAVLAPDRPELALHWNNLGGALARAGDLVSAGAAYERALALKDTHGAPPASLVVTLVNLAGVERRLRRRTSAQARYERALALVDADPDADPRVRAVIVDGLRELGRASGTLIELEPRRRPEGRLH